MIASLEVSFVSEMLYDDADIDRLLARQVVIASA